MKLGIVVPRYGDASIGGAERALRQLGEHLVSLAGWEVEAFATCARSAVDWADVEEPGTFDINGVTVHRFESVSGRDPRWGGVAVRVEESPTTVDGVGQKMYIDMQGPVNPDMIEAATASDADLLALGPYLFWPTVEGVRANPDRSILHGAAHDEPALHLGTIERTYVSARAVSYYSEAERDLVQGLFPVAHKPGLVLGLGVDPVEIPAGAAEEARRRYGIDDRPYLMCLGRLENGKGARALDAFFREYKARRPGPLALVFVGPAHERLDPHPDVIVTDAVDEADKWGLLAGSEIVVNPSAMESFSIVVPEAWLAGRPVMVNARCAATVEHITRGRGGIAFEGYPTFEAGLDRLLSDPVLRRQLAEAGREYTIERFSWPAVVSRYADFCHRLTSVT